MSRARVASSFVALLFLIALAAPAQADWTTYRGDSGRSGIDSSSVGSLPFAPAWTSPDLGGDMYAQPLVYKGLVIVATEANDIYALNESTGQVAWHVNAGTPVPDSQLPCGDISPTVGITSTPVIDPTTNRVFAVADTWDGSNPSTIAHHLVGYNLADGSPVGGLPIVVDPAGQDPTAQLQRPALALDGGKVVIGFGGNAGDCGTYHGWLVAAPETGGALQAFEVETPDSSDPGANGGAIWGSGTGPAVDSSGNVWAATGNGFGSTFRYQESVLKLDSNLNLLDHWAPSDWSNLDNSDTDIGSSEPLLLPGGLVFQIGKEGVGYLLSSSPGLGGTGATPAFQAPVCGGSYGGAIYYAGVIYVACYDGLRALSLNTSAPSFAALPGWQVHSGAAGPPILAGGLVWTTNWKAGHLYGLDPLTGNATVSQTTPGMDHFATPSASDGKLFLATGSTVEAYTIATPAPPSPNSPPPNPASGQPPPQTPTCGCTGSRCRLRLKLKVPRHARLIAAGVYFNRKLVGSKRGRKLKQLSFTPPAHRTSFTVRVHESTSSHRKLTITIRYSQCRRVVRH